jgi:DNA topoisomerase-1
MSAKTPEKISDVKLFDENGVVKIKSKDDARKLLEGLKNKFTISDIKTRQAKQSPDPPFITSSLQQEAYAKHSFGIKKTMQLAQELYENGHITYMRTDSYNLSDDFKQAAQAFVNDVYGDTYWDGGASAKKRKAKNSQEAHEAIRPTDPHLTELPAGGKFTNDHRKLYDLIWKRTIASLLKQAIFDEMVIYIKDRSMIANTMAFVANIRRVKYNGYLVVYGQRNESYDFQKFKDSIKGITCDGILAKNTWSSPPARFNDSSIIKVLENEGIGRPSTYASILTKLLEKNYVIKTDVAGVSKPTVNFIFNNGKITEEKSEVVIGAEKTRLVPTNIGREIDAYLSERFPYIVDKRFTSTMEGDLDQIAVGDKSRDDVLNVFWGTFAKDLAAETQIKQAKKKIETEANTFTVNGKNVNVRIARYGPVIEVMNGSEKKFIPLTNYLKYKKKEYMDVDESDIKFLMKFPVSVTGSQGEHATLEMGPYGIYMKSAAGNHRMPFRMIMDVINNGGKIDPEEVTSVINYKSGDKDSKSDTIAKGKKGTYKTATAKAAKPASTEKRGRKKV